MGRKSKAQLARLENLKKRAPNDYRVTVEDATDSEDEFDDPDYNQTASGTLHESSNLEREGSEGDFEEIRGQFILVEDDLSDDESDLDSEDGDWELDDEEEAEIKDEAALLSFSEVLRTGQELATAAEKLKWGQKKRPRQYTKNSARTFRRRKGLREKLEATGQPSILAWIQSVKERNATNDSEGSETACGDSVEIQGGPASPKIVSVSDNNESLAYKASSTNSMTCERKRKNPQRTLPPKM
jgi:hypothetical protein